MGNKSILIIAAWLACCNLAMAQKDTSGIRQLDDVVVTATRYPIKQNLTGKVLTVITREQLEKSSGLSVGELLNMQSGIIINGSGNTSGTNQSIYLQGADAGKTLILIDGVPAYDPSGTTNAYDLNLVNIDQVERIEILKGSQSTLYGSDAIAGVINIITKKGGGKPFNASANLSGGSYGTYKGAFGVNGQVHNTSYNVQYTRLKSDGISSAYDSTGKQHFDNDGFSSNTLLANIGQKIGSNLQLKGNFQFNKYNTGLDAGAYTDDKNYTAASKNIIAGIGADYKLGEAILHFNYNYNTVKRTYLDDSVAGINPNYSYGAYTGNAHYAELYSNIALTKYIDLLLGADYRAQLTEQHYLSISSFGPYQTDIGKDSHGKDSARVTQQAGYASLVLKDIHGFNFEIGVRYNHFSRYGNVFTYSMNPSYVINSRFKIFANLSSGFQAPTLYELYSEYRNPNNDLKPERSTSFEGGLQFIQKQFNARAVYFIRSVTDNIVFYTDTAYYSYYINLDKQKDHGLELEATYQVGKFRISANYTYLSGRVQTQVNGKDTSFNNLYRRPRNTLNLGVGIQATKRLFASASMHSLGKRFEYIYGASPVAMPSYYTIDVYGEYAICRQFKLFADFKNITNQRYFDLLGYNSKRFNFMVGVLVRID